MRAISTARCWQRPELRGQRLQQLEQLERVHQKQQLELVQRQQQLQEELENLELEELMHQVKLEEQMQQQEQEQMQQQEQEQELEQELELELELELEDESSGVSAQIEPTSSRDTNSTGAYDAGKDGHGDLSEYHDEEYGAHVECNPSSNIYGSVQDFL